LTGEGDSGRGYKPGELLSSTRTDAGARMSTGNNLAVPTRPFVSRRNAPVGGGGGGVRSFESAPYVRPARARHARPGLGPWIRSCRRRTARRFSRANRRVGRRINTGSRGLGLCRSNLLPLEYLIEYSNTGTRQTLETESCLYSNRAAL